MPLTQVHEAYNQVLVQPAEMFDLKTFNSRLLKPEYKIFFDFLQKVFMAFAGTHESVTLPEIQVYHCRCPQIECKLGKSSTQYAV